MNTRTSQEEKTIKNLVSTADFETTFNRSNFFDNKRTDTTKDQLINLISELCNLSDDEIKQMELVFSGKGIILALPELHNNLMEAGFSDLAEKIKTFLQPGKYEHLFHQTPADLQPVLVASSLGSAGCWILDETGFVSKP